jgi:Plus-3 domain
LQEFEKIVIGRKEMAKWIENSDFRNGLRGSFVKVMYHGKYVIARIEDFTVGADTYKVEQRDTQWQV